MTVRTWTHDDVRQAVRETTAASGVPEKITDPVLLDRLAALLRPTVVAASPDVMPPSRPTSGEATSRVGRPRVRASSEPDPRHTSQEKNTRRPSMSGDRSTGARQQTG